MAFPRRALGILVAVVIVAGLGAGVYLRIRGGGESDDETASSDAELPDVSAASAFSASVAIPVEGAETTRDTLVLSVTASGQAAGSRRAVIAAQVDGRIESVPVRESQAVTDEQRLVSIGSDEYELALEEAQAQLAQAEAQYRELVLFNDMIEDPEVRTEQERTARARSGLTTAEVGLRRAEMNLARAMVTAPFAGRIANVEVVQGQWVRATDELMTIVDIDPIKVEVQVLEGAVGYLAPGHDAQIIFAALPDTVFTGRIATINPIVDEQSRTATVTVFVDNPDGRVLPGMYARVALEAQRFADRILVPRAAVLERGVDRRTMLFVYEEGEAGTGLAKWRYVTTGLENDSLVEIVPNPDTEMVEPGEIVLIDGHYTLTHDARVRVVQDVRAAGGRPQ